jgi:RND superfamily putative drug exporter
VRRLGRLATRRRWWVIGMALLFVPAAAMLGGSAEERLSAGGLDDPAAESSRAAALLDRDFGTGAPNFLLLVTVHGGSVDRPPVAAAGMALTRRLASEPGVGHARSYWSAGAAPSLRSRDGAQALVLARVQGDENQVRRLTGILTPRYQSDGPLMAVAVGGEAEVARQVNLLAKHDLGRAEAISVPLTLLRLLLVFGGVVAAGLPLSVGVIAVVGTLALLRLLTGFTPVSTFALNLTTAMGLALAIDYSLFVVSRYREELRSGHDFNAAVMRTVQTAGRTVLFSALTVAASLAALLVFPLDFLRSFAYAGIGVVALAAVGAALVLPAVLGVLGPLVDWGRLFRPRVREVTAGFWYRRARGVMRRPVRVIVAVVGLLVVLGLPFSRIQLGLIDARVLPAGTPVRTVDSALRAGFTNAETSALTVVAGGTGNPATLTGPIDRYAGSLSRVPGVSRVDALTGAYRAGVRVPGPTAMSARFATPTATWLSVVPSVDPLSPAGEAVVHAVRGAAAPFPVVVGGPSAQLVDTKAAILNRLPLALLIIAVTTFVLLFLMVGSLLVPVKALALNILSLSATFGGLVWVFQDGHLSGFLRFTPTGTISVVVPMLLFCIAFGLSMDYEVFLLSRIKEEYDQSGDNDEAVAVGLQRTGRIVTAAAVILAFVYLAFATSGVTVVKLLGLGLTLAVVIDAFLIRLTLVPALMHLAGRANWWAPRAVRRLHLRVGIWEVDPLPLLEVPGVVRARLPHAPGVPVAGAAERTSETPP